MFEKSLYCPNCNHTKLHKVNCGENLELDQCPKCKGYWFDKGELDQISKLHDFYKNQIDTSVNTDVQTSNIRKCPHCNLELEKIKPNTKEFLVIDRCVKCKGIWLDSGELTKLLNNQP